MLASNSRAVVTVAWYPQSRTHVLKYGSPGSLIARSRCAARGQVIAIERITKRSSTPASRNTAPLSTFIEAYINKAQGCPAGARNPGPRE